MSVKEKAWELGMELCKSKEFLNMHEAEAVMLHNKEAGELISEFQRIQKSLQMIVSGGHSLTAEQESEFNELEKKILENPYIYNYFKAQQDFDRFLEEVNEIIADSIRKNS